MTMTTPTAPRSPGLCGRDRAGCLQRRGRLDGADDRSDDRPDDRRVDGPLHGAVDRGHRPDAAQRDADPAGRRRDLPEPALPGLVREVHRGLPEHQVRLPVDRLRRRDQGDHRADRRLRRLRRPDEGRGDRGPAGRQQDAPHPDRPRCRRRHLQRLRASTSSSSTARTSPASSSATITKWNDPKIAANNAGATLPDKAILVVHRSDGSGTTNAFTSYLDTVSPDWHTEGRQGQGSQVAGRPGRGRQRRRRRRRSSRPKARSATSSCSTRPRPS